MHACNAYNPHFNDLSHLLGVLVPLAPPWLPGLRRYRRLACPGPFRNRGLPLSCHLKPTADRRPRLLGPSRVGQQPSPASFVCFT